MGSDEVPHRNVVFKTVYSVSPPLELERFEGSPNDLIIGFNPASGDSEVFYVGKPLEAGQTSKNLWLDKSRAHAIYVVGKRRSGKSYTLGMLAEGLVSENWMTRGSQKFAVLVLDTLNVFQSMGNLAADSSESAKKALTDWGLPVDSEIRVNVLYPSGTKQSYYPSHFAEFSIKTTDLTIEEWCALFDLDPITDPMGQLLSDLLADMEDRPDYSLADMVKCLSDGTVGGAFESKTVEALRRRLDSLRRNPLFGSSGIKLSDIFKEGHITVLLLRELPAELRSEIAAIIARTIFAQRGSSDDIERRMTTLIKKRDMGKASPADESELGRLRNERISLPRGWVLVDEAHNYIPAVGAPPSKKPLVKLVKEGRNIGLSVVFVTQSPASLDSSIMRNANILVIHSLSFKDDIQAVQSMINTGEFESLKKGGVTFSSGNLERVIRGLELGEAIISDDSADRIFMAKIRPRVTVHSEGREY